MATLTINKNYLNPYEAAHDVYKGTPLYSELGGDSTWQQFAKEGRLDNLITLLDDASNYKGGVTGISNKYNFQYLDNDAKLSAVANELYEDRDTLNEYTRYDGPNGDYFYSDNDSLLKEDAYKDYTSSKVQMSAYDYNKYQIDNYVKYKQAQEARQIEIDEKNDINGFVKFLASTGATVMRVGQSALGQIQNIGSAIAGLGDYLVTGIGSGDWDRADEAFRSWFQGNEILEDELSEFERKYTYYRDIDGNITSVGKVMISLADSAGQMLPTIAMSFIPVVGQIVGNVSYWVGMAGASMREFVNDESMASVPTWQILASSGIKATLQYGVTKVLNGFLGGASFVDKLVFGYSSSAAGGSVVGKFLTDAVHEGIEEVLQEFTDMFTDSAMSFINESFGAYGKRTYQDYIDAFTLGALGSIFMGGFGYVVQPRANINVAKTDKYGNIQYDRKGNIKYKKLGLSDSFKLNNGISTLFENYNQIINGNISNVQRNQLTGQMAVAFRTIANVYGTMGADRFTNANNLLTQIVNQNKSQMTDAMLKNIAADILTDYEIITARYEAATQEEAVASHKSKRRKITKQEAANKLADAKVTQVDRVVTKDDVKSEITADSKTKFENEVLNKIFNANPDVKKVVVSKDGEKPVQVGDTLVVSQNQLSGLGEIGIQKSLSEQRLVENVSNMTMYKKSFKSLRDIWNKLNPNNKIDNDQDIIYQVFFNNTFFKIALQAANIDTSRFLTALNEIEQAATANTSVDAQYKHRIENILKNRYQLLVEYYINQQEDTSYKTNGLFDDKQIKFIENKRHSYDLRNRIVKGEKLSQDDLIVIGNRINYLPIKQETKNQLRENIFSTQQVKRIAGMNKLSEAYRDIYTSPYDGKTYLQNDTLGNITWNTWAQQSGLTIKTLSAPIVDEDLSQVIKDTYGEVTAETTMQFYKDAFRRFSNDTYQFDYRNGRVLVSEYSTLESPIEEVSYKKLPESTYDIGHIPGDQTFVLASKIPDGLVEQFVQEDIQYRSLMTFDDIVKDYNVLSGKTKQNIIDKYGKLNSRNTFLYLRSELNKKGYTLTVTKNGQFVVASVKKALSLLKNPTKSWTDFDVNKTYSIQEFVKPVARDEGFLKSTTITFGTGSYYDPNTNSIVLDKTGINNKDYMNAAFLHEYQHAVQYANNWNGGISSTWVTDYNVSRDTIDRMLKDLQTHVPEILQGVTKREARVAVLERFVYETSGEAQALGIENKVEYNVVYPTIVNMTQKNAYIVMPWGTKYKVTRIGLDTKNSWSLRKNSDTVEFVKDILDPKYYPDYYKLSTIYNVSPKNEFTTRNVIAGANEVTMDYLYGYIATNSTIESQEYHKQQYERSITPERKIKILQVMNQEIAPNVPFNDFLNMDIPLVRFQFGNQFMYDEMSSFTAGDDGLNLLKRIILSKINKNQESTPYIFVGTFKPKDIISYMKSTINEVLIEPSKVSHFKQYALDYDVISTGVILKIISSSEVDIRKHNINYFTEKIPQNRGSITVSSEPQSIPLSISKVIDYHLLRLDEIKDNVTLSNYGYFILFPDRENAYSLHYEEYDYYLLDNILENARQEIFANDFSVRLLGNQFEQYTNNISTIEYDSDADAYIVRLGNFIDTDSINNISKLVLRHISDSGIGFPTNIIFDSRYFKLQEEYNLQDGISPEQISFYISSYIDHVNEYVAKNNEDNLINELANTQPSEQLKTPEYIKGEGVYNLYNQEDIANFKKGVQDTKALQERVNSEEAKKYEKLAKAMYPDMTDERIQNRNAASKYWLKYILNLTDNDYVPIMNFSNDTTTYDFLRIPVDPHPSYEFDYEGNYKLRTGVTKISNITRVNPEIKNGMITARVKRSGFVNISPTNDIEFDADRQGFTITNPETDIVFNKQSFAKPRKNVPFSKRRKNEGELTGKERDAARYISNEKARGTNLEYFIKRNVPIRMDPSMQDLIVNLDQEQTDKALWSMIGGKQKGTLTKQKLYEYTRTAKNMNDYTFKMINKYIFQNPAIKNFKQLKAYADISPADYFALRTVLQTFNKESYLERKLNYAQVRQIIDELKKRPDWNKLYQKIYNMYSNYRGEYVLDVDHQNLRIMFMKYFDGSIDSGADVASMARWLAVHSFKTPGQISTTSLEKSIGDEITLADTIADKSSSEFVSSIGGYVTETEMMDAILDYKYSKLYGDSKYLELTPEQLKAEEQKISELVEDMTSEEILKEYTAIQVAEENTNDEYFEAVDNAVAKEIRPRKNILANIKRMANRTIAQNLNAKAVQRFKKANPDFFDDNNRLNEKLYKGVPYTKLVELESRVRELSKQVRQGLFNSQMSQDYINKINRLTKKITKQQEEIDKLRETVWKYEKTETREFAKDVEFVINSDMPIPEKLSTMLSSAFKKSSETTNESKVQFVTEDNVENAKISMEEFIDTNAEILDSLVNGEVEDIIDYYKNSMVVDTSLTRNSYRAYQSYEVIILSYFLEMQRTNVVQLTDEQVSTIKSILNTVVSNASTLMSTWRKAMEYANPVKRITMSLRRSSGLDISEADVNSLTAALNLTVGETIVQNKPDGSTVTIDITNKYKIDAISKAMHDAEVHLMEQYNQKQKARTKPDIILSKLTDFRRMMMLSGPGTAIRNLSSNAIVYGANITAGKVGNVTSKILSKIPKLGKKYFTKSSEFLGKQWKISDTKVPEHIKTFTDGFFEHTAYTVTDSKTGKVKEVSFYDAIADGLTKYDPRRVKRVRKDTDVTSSTGKSLTEMASELMIQKVVNNIYNQHRFDSQMDTKFEKLNKVAQTVGKGLNKVNNFVFWLLQDDPWIKKMTKYYFQRMLVESQMPLRQGVSTRTLDLFAEAYTKAAYDFMHKPNVWNKIEQAIHTKMGPGAYFAFKTVFPFASASWNWFVEALNYTSIGLAKGIIQYAKVENTVQKMEASIKAGDLTYSPRFALYEAKKTIGKGIFGSVGTLIGILLAGVGLADIDDEDGKLKLRVADVYIDISDLFGSQGILMGLALMSPKYDSEMDMVGAITTVLDSLFADSIFTDLYNSFQYVDSIGEWMLNETEDMLTSYVPNFLKTFNSLLYTHQIEYSPGILGSIEYFGVSLVPGLAYALPKRYDPYTGEVKTKFKLQWLVNFINRLSPFDIMPYNISDIEKEAIVNEVAKGELTGRYDDIGQLNSEQLEALNKKYGELNKNDLDNFINGGAKYSVQSENGTYQTLSYSQMTSEQKKRVIERIMSNNASYAKIYVYTQIIGGKYYASSSEFNTLRSLGITKNLYRATNKLEGFIAGTTN